MTQGDRARLVARDPIAALVASFVEGDWESLEIICPEPGTVVGGVTFGDTVTSEQAYHRIYDIVKRGGWLKVDVWVQKKGRSVWLHRYDPREAKDGG